MDLTNLIWFLLIGAAAGFIAGQIMKGRGFGAIGNIVVGIVGAFIGGFLLPAVGVNLGAGIVAAIASASIGAIVLLFAISFIKQAT